MLFYSFFWGRTISTDFTEAERTRFRNLLELANSSKFEGERKNALAAAERIARKHGLSMEEAARGAPPEPQVRDVPFAYNQSRDVREFEFTSWRAAQTEKKRWEEAVQKARARGLDDDQNAGKSRANARNFSRARRNPFAHARVLLKETSLPFEEIADITGLDVYIVVGLKLKLRKAA